MLALLLMLFYGLMYIFIALSVLAAISLLTLAPWRNSIKQSVLLVHLGATVTCSGAASVLWGMISGFDDTMGNNQLPVPNPAELWTQGGIIVVIAGVALLLWSAVVHWTGPRSLR